MTITFNKDVVQENKQPNLNKDFKVGKVSFVVEAAEERHSEKSGAFILLKLSLMNQERQVAKATTCLFFTDNLLWRVKSFCSCVGEDNLFNSGSIDSNAFIGLEGEAIADRNKQGYIDIKKFFPRIITLNKTNDYNDLNNSSNMEKVMDDDLPF